MRILKLRWVAPLLLSAVFAAPLAAQVRPGGSPTACTTRPCPVAAPEIAVGSGLAALAVLLAGLALAYERRRGA